MKALVKTFAAAVLITLSTFAMATEKKAEKTEKASVNLSTAGLALDHYVAVKTKGESAGIEQLFAEDFSQNVHSSQGATNSRNAVVDFFKKQKGEKLNCNVSAQIIEKSADYMIAKVTMKFENFTMTDLVTLVRKGDSWKVSKSINSYK
ncbi:MAG: nuclear transport factor 2 family protein [Sphingobacterium sp.]